MHKSVHLGLDAHNHRCVLAVHGPVGVPDHHDGVLHFGDRADLLCNGDSFAGQILSLGGIFLGELDLHGIRPICLNLPSFFCLIGCVLGHTTLR